MTGEQAAPEARGGFEVLRGGETGPTEVERRDVAFELDGRVYELKMKLGHPKDMLLLDRITGGRALEIAAAAEAEADDPDALESWGPTWTIAVVATSIRAAHPDWSVERVYDRVMRIEDIDAEIAWLGGESEAQQLPPAPSGDESTQPTSSTSSADDSLSSPTPTESSHSATSSATPR